MIKAEPCDDMEQSYLGGCSESSFHKRTVASLEAERTTEGWGKVTPRTYVSQILWLLTWIIAWTHVVFVLLKRGRESISTHVSCSKMVIDAYHRTTFRRCYVKLELTRLNVGFKLKLSSAPRQAKCGSSSEVFCCLCSIPSVAHKPIAQAFCRCCVPSHDPAITFPFNHSHHHGFSCRYHHLLLIEKPRALKQLIHSQHRWHVTTLIEYNLFALHQTFCIYSTFIYIQLLHNIRSSNHSTEEVIGIRVALLLFLQLFYTLPMASGESLFSATISATMRSVSQV